MGEKVNDTILKMVDRLKAPVQSTSFTFGASLKRSFSSGSNESHFSFEATPVKRFKKEASVSYLGSPREVRRLRADLLESRNTILNLESRISKMHGIRKEMELLFEDEIKTLKRQHEHDSKTVTELEEQLQVVRKREAEAKEKLSSLNCELNVLKVKKDEEIEKLEKSLSEVSEESRVFDSEENAEIVSLNRRVGELQMMLDAAEEDAEAQKALVHELEKKLAERNAGDRDLEKKEQALQFAKMRIKELEYAKDNFLEFQGQAKSQAHKLANYIELEKEVQRLREDNVRLKDAVRNKLLLEEEVHNLKLRVVTFKEQEKRLLAAQAQQTHLEAYLNEWRSVARGVCETTGSDASLPHLLRAAVERLQQQEITLTSAKVELESSLNTALYEGKVAKSELEKSQKMLSEMQTTTAQKTVLFTRMQKRLALVSRERDSYRQQLDSYEKDLTLNPSAGGAPGVSADKERIENLEKLLEGYRDLNAKLEGDLQGCHPQANDSPKLEQLAKLQEEVAQLRMENDRLKQRRDQLEIQMENHIVGDDSLHGGQVYHPTNNPLSECLALREKLLESREQEIKALKRKVKNLEDGLEASKLNESIPNSQEAQQLREQIKNHESQTNKLKEYFKSSMKEFRNVVYMLLGYKVDRPSTSLYKLTSVYAEREEDQLCFQINGDGALNLLENDFSATLENMVTLHLRHQNSIPVFLSALTIDLFNNSTIATRTFEIE